MKLYRTIPGALLLLPIIFALFACTQAPAANVFIVAGGTGSKTGADWNNALPDIPIPSCGNSYFVAGGTYNRKGGQTWTADCNASAQIFVYKAVDCGVISSATYCSLLNPAKIQGWQPSYGSRPAIFVQATTGNLEASGSGFMQICGNYYTLDGITPITGTPTTSGFGFVWRNPNPRANMILVSTNSCPVQPIAQTHITIRHSEFDGVDPQYGYNILACSRRSNVVTLTMATSPQGWLTGNSIDVQNTTPSDFNTGQSGLGVTITSLSERTIKFNQPGPDENCSVPGYAVLNYSAGKPINVTNVNETFDTITVTDNYMHDIGGGVRFTNVTNLDFERNYVARNRSTFTQHEYGFNIESGGNFTSNGGIAGNPAIVGNNIFENITGTQVAGTISNGANINDFRYYNNVAFCTDDAGPVNSAATPQCGVARAVGDNGTANPGSCITNAQVIGNTFYGGARIQVDYRIEFLNFGCSTVTLRNNLWVTNGKVDLNLGKSYTEDHNTVIGTGGSKPSILASASDSIQISNVQNPFVSTIAPVNLQLVSETVLPHLNDGLPLGPPFNVDLTSSPRGTGATWDRGAYQFDAANTPPAAPKITQVLVQ
jgi:hypothetical protein